MSVFEITMLACFGFAWPFSICRSWKSRTTAGKSVWFLWVVFAGYLAGIVHKLLYSHDLVTCLYMLNAAMVGADIALYYRNLRLVRAVSCSDAGT